MQAAAIAQMLGSLVLVVLLIFACAWMAKRMPLNGAGRSGVLQLKASLSVGARERVVLVQAGSKSLVLGVAPGRVNTLHVLDENLAGEEAFAQVLKQADQS